MSRNDSDSEKYEGPTPGASATGDSALYSSLGSMVGGVGAGVAAHSALSPNGEKISQWVQAYNEPLLADADYHRRVYAKHIAALEQEPGFKLSADSAMNGVIDSAPHALVIERPALSENGERIISSLVRSDKAVTSEAAHLEAAYRTVADIEKRLMTGKGLKLGIVAGSVLAGIVTLGGIGSSYGFNHGWKKGERGKEQFEKMKAERDTAIDKAEVLQSMTRGIVNGSLEVRNGGFAARIQPRGQQGNYAEAALAQLGANGEPAR